MATLRLPVSERENLAARIREQMEHADVVHVIYEPGDGTFYELVFADARSSEPLIATDYDVDKCSPRLGGPSVRWVVVWIDHGAIPLPFGPENYWHPTFLLDHFQKCTNEHAAVVVAELLNMLCDPNSNALASMREQYDWIFG